MRVKLVGVSFIDGYPQTANTLQQMLARDASARGDGDAFVSVQLRREPENPHDPNAILVVCGEMPLGHIKREIAAMIAQQLDAVPDAWVAMVDEVAIHPDHPDRPGIWLRLNRRP